jgi:integrase
MPKERTGTVWYDDERRCYAVKISLNDGARPTIFLTPTSKSPEAEGRAHEVAKERSRIAREEDHRAEDYGLPPRKPKAAATAAAPPSTMQSWLDAWVADREARGVTTKENLGHYRHHIEAAMGGKHLRDWTDDDFRRLSRELDAKVQRQALNWKTAWNIWSTASRMCKDACRSKLDELRVCTDNPARDVAGPDRGAHTAKQYLYPSEFSRFVACEDVPLNWRRLVALAIYLFPRAGEMRVLRWEDVDLEHGTLHVHRAQDRRTKGTKPTKTKHARRFSIEPALLPLLRAMHEEGGGELVIRMPSERALARALRRWLMRADVKRTELHEDAPTRKSIIFHDLRATGLTWMAVRGDDPLKIQRRAGHEDFQTTQGYIREAEAIREGFGVVFPELPASLLGSGGSSGPSSGPIERRGSEHLERGPMASAVALTAAIPVDPVFFNSSASFRVPSTPLCLNCRLAPAASQCPGLCQPCTPSSPRRLDSVQSWSSPVHRASNH